MEPEAGSEIFWCALALACIRHDIVAPQAPLEESATTEASRRCSLTGFLREFGVLFSGHIFEASASGI